MSIRKVPSCEEAKEQISMVKYLAELGFQPARVAGNDFWYRSPLHDEKTPSFKVNIKLNCWYDWGTGEKGNLIDFGLAYHKCNISEFLNILSRMKLDYILKPDIKATSIKKKREEEKKITVTVVKDLYSYALLNYLQKRRIPEKIARQLCKEVHYSLNNKNYYAIGFKNDSGGYELRNEYIKASSSPKGSTFIDNGAVELAVFEGFFNFLSYKAMLQGQTEPHRNYLILNSTSFFDQQLPKMQEHTHCYLYLDNDKTGNACTHKALAISPVQFIDERKLYQNKEDLNAWLVNIGQKHRNSLTIKR